jgi:dTDP-4-amino-4,6-dideoxygalactose transaminase
MQQTGDRLLRWYERRLAEFGDTAQGAHWPNEHDRRTRFDVMLDVIEQGGSERVVLCDLGCGTGELLAHIRRRGFEHIDYIGVDRSRRALAHARAKFSDAPFIELDVAAPDADLRPIACDYLVANGLFTGKFDLSHDEMWSFLVATIERVWPHVRRGLAFNVMSKVVEWERGDLFHLPMDEAAGLLHRLAGRRVRMRADYGLYEYTCYAYKPPSESVPVLRPLLPSAERLLPYLRRIDASRIYTNHGPLTAEFEARLAAHLSLPADGVACAGSGTAALLGAILAAAGQAREDRPLALIPAFTFVATAGAAEMCGYRPHLVDIDANSWMLEAERLIGHPMLAQTGLVIPVAPFGRPVPQQPWRQFRERTGIPVVIDGAASFDRIEEAPARHLGPVPLALSFHATKGFATGEGGAVVSSDADFVERAARALNFGFSGSRDAQSAATNGKMSEYHAAVGLAEFDGWEKKRAALAAVIDRYRLHMEKAGLIGRFVAAPVTSLVYAFYRCRDLKDTEAVENSLLHEGIDTRWWYGLGLHRQSYFTGLSHDELKVTDATAPYLIGLPTAPDLTDAQITRVVAALAAGVAAGKRSSSHPAEAPPQTCRGVASNAR